LEIATGKVTGRCQARHLSAYDLTCQSRYGLMCRCSAS